MFSTEIVKIDLRKLNSSARSFVAIARSLGAQISDPTLSRTLAGERSLDIETENKLLDILERMKDLQAEIGLPLDWSDTEPIVNALSLRLLARVAREMAIENDGLQQAAAQATQQVGKG